MAGTGGSETYTIGQLKELLKRGIPARILTVGLGKNDGRKFFPGLPFKAVTAEELATLDDTIVFINEVVRAKTKHPSYVIFHCPPPNIVKMPAYRRWVSDKTIMVPSKYAAGVWAKWLNMPANNIHVVHPFAAPAFGEAATNRPENDPPRILYAGRLSPDKGIYTLMAALHFHKLSRYDITVTDAGAHTPAGLIIKPLIKVHPLLKLVKARKTPADMAELIAEHDLVVMPTGGTSWTETFGMLSVEAQHAGRRVVASNLGGLPETNCGGLTLVKPHNANLLAAAIANTVVRGHLTKRERAKAKRLFTVEQSVDKLLQVLNGSQAQ